MRRRFILLTRSIKTSIYYYVIFLVIWKKDIGKFIYKMLKYFRKIYLRLCFLISNYRQHFEKIVNCCCWLWLFDQMYSLFFCIRIFQKYYLSKEVFMDLFYLSKIRENFHHHKQQLFLPLLLCHTFLQDNFYVLE